MPVWPARGEMGEAIRTFDWSATPVGPISSWPQSLRTAVALMLGARQPVYIAWGPEHLILHNDALVPILGDKYPGALGAPFKLVWAEIWEAYRPFIDATMAGEAHHWVDEPLALHGRSDRPMSWFTFSWTPLHADGLVAGFYCAATETTDTVMAERALVESIDEGFCMLEMVFDDAGVPIDYRYIKTNHAFEQQSGLVNAKGKTIRQLLPDIESHWISMYARVSATGEPIRVTEEVTSMGKWFDVYAFRSGDAKNGHVGVLFRDVSAQKRVEQALREAQMRAESALAIAELGTFVWEMGPDVVECSARTREIFGFQRHEGRTSAEYFNRIIDDDIESVRSTLQAGMEGDGRTQVEYRISLPDGSVRHVACISTCQKGSGDHWVRQVGVFSDITRRKQIEQELIESVRRKDEFLAMLAHELRNPLAPIAAAAELLGRGVSDEAWLKQASAIITRQVGHMTGLVDDLLDVSRVTRGLVKLEMSRLDTTRIVFDAVEQAGPLMEARRHQLVVRAAPTSALVWGDHKRMVQVITNLLNNAARYTQEGGEIVLHMQADESDVTLTVSDNGIGMTRELVQRSFELFSQAERTADRSQGGLGIGLALVRSLVELHGGTVSAHSEGLGKGSTFTVQIPRLQAIAHEHAAYQSELSGTEQAAALKIMVVDDNVDAAQTLALLLTTIGHEVVVEHDARAALKRSRVELPDACLLDIGLPDMDGYELAKRLRAQAETAGTLLVAVTGYGRDQDQDRGNAGDVFDHHFVKPVDSARLAQVLAGISRADVKADAVKDAVDNP